MMSRRSSIFPGQQYGHWTVLKDAGWIGSNHCYLCRCECGNEKPVAGTSLKSGCSTSCGCQKNYTISRGRDLSGQTMGYWKVLSLATRSKQGARRYLCRCICGTERVVVEASLLSGHSKSCGCRRGEGRSNGLNLTGQTINNWLVLAPAERSRQGRKRYLCRCVCGTEHVVAESALLNGRSKSCGCGRAEILRRINQKRKENSFDGKQV